MATTTHYRACNVCEAICGLAIEVEDGQVLRIRGDAEDPFSAGHICPKALALKDLQEDPDRLRRPLRRDGDGWREIDWDEAIDYAAERLCDIAEAAGDDAVAFYLGNPNVHNYGALTHYRRLLAAVGSRNVYSATSVDQLAHHVACHHLYGHQMLVPVPDVDRTDCLLVIGANPMVSNGSMMTAPGMRKRLRALGERGGELLVVDPRRTETAAIADHHYALRPGTDAVLLLALLHHLHARGLTVALPGDRFAGLAALPALLEPWTPERAAAICDLPAAEIVDLAERFGRAGSAACYGRLGVSTQAFGGLCQWLIQLLNIVTGNLDREGGTLVPDPAVDLVRQRLLGRGSPGRSHTRVRGLPGFGGELPSAALVEEIETPGEGRIRALVTLAGNPVSSTPNGDRLAGALAGLDFMLSVDFYLNETTRRADLILPPTTPLEHDHYDFAFLSLAVRNVTRFNEAVLPAPAGARHDWEIAQGLADAVNARRGRRGLRHRSPERLLAIAIANGPRGRRRGHPDALDLERVRAAPHGLDLGPLEPGLLRRLQTPDGRVACLPDAYRADLERLARRFPPGSEAEEGTLTLIGRRDARSNNSWLHNYPRFVKGTDRCRLLIHPEDAEARGIADGAPVRVRSANGEIEVHASRSETVRRGVVCLPHGWGQGRDGVRLGVAAAQPGASYNDLTGPEVDPVTGSALLSGIAVEVLPGA